MGVARRGGGVDVAAVLAAVAAVLVAVVVVVAADAADAADAAVAPIVTAAAVACAAGLAAELALVVPAVAVAVPVDAVAASAGSMTHKARGGWGDRQVSKVWTVAEAAVGAAVAGDGFETVCSGTTSGVSGRTVAADSVRGFFARLGRMPAKMAG